MQLTIDNKITLIYGMLLLLFFIVSYVTFYKNKEHEYLNITDNSAYVYNTGNATLGNLTITGDLTAGPTIINQDGIFVGTSKTTTGSVVGKIAIDDTAGSINVGPINVARVSGLTVGSKNLFNESGTLGPALQQNPNFTSATNIAIGGTVISAEDGSIRTNNNLKCGPTIISAEDGSVKTLSTTGQTTTIFGSDGSTNITSLNVGNGKTTITNDGTTTTTGNISTNKLISSSDLTIGGILAMPNNAKLTSFSTDGHVELSTNNGSGIVYYGVDGTIRKWKSS